MIVVDVTVEVAVIVTEITDPAEVIKAEGRVVAAVVVTADVVVLLISTDSRDLADFIDTAGDAEDVVTVAEGFVLH